MHKHHEDSISQQLKKGIRLLDICCGVDNFVSHGPLTIANTYVEDALDVVKRFLERNNTETVVVLLNWSSSILKVLDSDMPWQQGGHSEDDEVIPPRFNRYMKTILKDDKFYYTGNTWPKIKDVRGKAVIACGWDTDHHGHGDKWGVAYEPPKWQPARFSTHQYTPLELIDERWEKIKNELHTPPEKHRAIVLAASLQHDPKTTKGWIVPRDTAAELQKQLRCHIDDGKKKIGGLWVFGDFMERETIMAISKLNWEGYNQDDRRRQVHVVSPHSKAQQALWRNQAAQALQGAI
ncbi:hypothetical protein CGLO_06850 [Colletotrichum gloeosporioides Cg-14]|uniref:Phosphatidylinositol-specific phospholipase C X domain-containing protein n=1 Tax=Colletotrichum gloeosporioides (strain Cg-14) TaxID=1237896 RepID=T0KKM4_COLGC|nr:hypothetical protein CGLO_06850 [Colletotrichum gloeosporioides Cg-14]